MTLLLILAPCGFSFALLLSMAHYERWALDPEVRHGEDGSEAPPVGRVQRGTADRPREPTGPTTSHPVGMARSTRLKGMLRGTPST